MPALVPSVSALAVSAIFCLWQAYRRQDRAQRARVLRDRVTFMLWEMAQRAA